MKRRYLLPLLAGMLCVLPLKAYAAPPRVLSRTSVEETERKCADADDFRVTYVFGDRTVTIDAASAKTWFVTRASRERMQAEEVSEENPWSGRFLIDGKECAFPEETRTENGFVTDLQGRMILSESAMYETMRLMFDQYNMRVEEGATVFYATSGRAVFFGAEPEQIAEVDPVEEFEILLTAFKNGSRDVTRHIHNEKTLADIETVSGDYIEVDAAEQMMYLYLDDDLYLSTPS